MSEAASNPKAYYVGINGEQKGPFSESQLAEMVANSEITKEDLVWYEGLSEWKPLKDIPQLNSPEGFAKTKVAASPPEEELVVPPKNDPTAKTKVGHVLSQPQIHNNFDSEPQIDSEMLQPVFDEGRANLSDSTFAKQRQVFVILGVLALVTAGGIGYFWWAQSETDDAKKNIKATKMSAEAARQLEFSESMSLLATDPEAAIVRLKPLFLTGQKDNMAKEALDAVLDYYRRQQRNKDAGQLLLEVKRPADALKYFIDDPATVKEAETALGMAAETAQAKEKKEYLTKQIGLLLGPLNDPTKAVERIKVLEKAFPGEAHPYGYYLKTVDQRIADIFSRTSFHFVSTLYSFLSTELPQINLVDRPLVEVKKNPEGEYRIIASYKGDVILNHDRLKNIYFVFWLSSEQWTVVDTNLTKERGKYGAQEREKHKTDVLNANEMLSFLENIFRQQFPKHALHELVTPESKKQESTTE